LAIKVGINDAQKKSPEYLDSYQQRETKVVAHANIININILQIEQAVQNPK
jgi:hypothetical protein